jgi:hypothetical protein
LQRTEGRRRLNVFTLKQASVALMVLGIALVFGCTSATSNKAAEADRTSSAGAYGMDENAQPGAPGNTTVEDSRQDLQDPQQTAQQAGKDAPGTPEPKPHQEQELNELHRRLDSCEHALRWYQERHQGRTIQGELP